MKVGVVGLGYVGATLACALSEAGVQVVGIDLNPERLPLTHIPELKCTGTVITSQDYSLLNVCDVVLIAVETPVGPNNVPNYTHLISAAQALGHVLPSGTLVIVESTVGPGTCEQMIKPALEAGGHTYRLGHCPERLSAGHLLYNVRNMSRVCGGDTPATAEAMVAFYDQFVEGALYPTNLVTAELVKTLENAYRDMQLAFSNEAAQICQMFGSDVWAVRDLVNTAPGRAMLEPGPGVGGSCLPKDPWLLMHASGRSWEIMRAARRVNDHMPDYVAHWISSRLPPPAKLGILGLAYRENTEDTRLSPATALGSALINRGFSVVHYDPVVFPHDHLEKLAGVAALVLATKHSAFYDLPWYWLAENVGRVFFDTRNFLVDEARRAGFEVHVLGSKFGNAGRPV